MVESAAESTVRLLDTDGDEHHFRDALAELFAGDGTIYVVSGYFTYQGDLDVRSAIVSFLERSRDNQLVVIVGTASDQFSGRIARDLWNLDEHDQVQLYRQSRGLHAKCYLRVGPNPRCIIGSANITRVAFEYNIELNVDLSRPSTDHPDIQQFLEWVTALQASSTPVRRRDIVALVQIGGSVVNWSNKARLLPKRDVALRIVPVLVVLLVLSGFFWLI